MIKFAEKHPVELAVIILLLLVFSEEAIGLIGALAAVGLAL
jgi:hypothetical protein